jgi:uncharacterized protein YjbJ (UPF0337 family)
MAERPNISQRNSAMNKNKVLMAVAAVALVYVANNQSGLAATSTAAPAIGNKTLAQALSRSPSHREDMAMDKDRIEGSAKQAKGAVRETAGKVLGDKKLETDGKADKAAGKVQNALGGLKDAVRGK